jgi:hypothetical protein
MIKQLIMGVGDSTSGGGATLFTFSSFTFTNASSTGRNGPTLAQCTSAYSTQPWVSSTANFNMVTQGIQLWTVPSTGTYRILATGAAGAQSNPKAYTAGGNGGSAQGDFTLTSGTILAILVGQMGTIPQTYSGGWAAGSGGGGSFVVLNSSNTPLIVGAGGGGGGDDGATYQTFQQGGQGSVVTNYTGSNGLAGNNGGGNGGAAGGGFNNNGVSGYNKVGGLSYLNGGTGGNGNVDYPSGQIGGFGGGGQGGGCPGGGGGGFIGGAYGPGNVSGRGATHFNSGSNQINTTGGNSGHGFVTITKL